MFGDHSVTSIIGARLRVEDYNFPPEFAGQFPKEGVVRERISALNGVKDWYLVELDQPVLYEGRESNRLLIRSRRHQTPISEDAVSVFILLMREPDAMRERPIDVRKFDHVGNGIAQVLSLDPEAARAAVKAGQDEERVRCGRCGVHYSVEHPRCPECDAWKILNVSPELELCIKIFAGLAVVLLIAWGVVTQDPTIPAFLRAGSFWLRILVVMGGLLACWLVLERIVRRMPKR